MSRQRIVPLLVLAVVLLGGCGLFTRRRVQNRHPRWAGPEGPPGGRTTRVFVGAGPLAQVLVIDPTSLQIAARFPTDGEPARLVLSPDGRRLYVAPRDAKLLLALDAATGREVGTGRLGARPLELAIDGDGGRMLVASGEAGEVRLLDTRDLSVRNMLPVGGVLGSVAVSPDGTRGFVARPDSGEVVPLDLEGAAIGAPWSVGGRPGPIGLAPDGGTLYVLDLDQGMLLSLDPASGAERGRLAVGAGAASLALAPDGRRAYIGFGGTAGGSVVPVDLGTSQVGQPVRLDGDPGSLAVLDGTLFATVPAREELALVDMANSSVKSSASLAAPLSGLAASDQVAVTAAGGVAQAPPADRTPTLGVAGTLAIPTYTGPSGGRPVTSTPAVVVGFGVPTPSPVAAAGGAAAAAGGGLEPTPFGQPVGQATRAAGAAAGGDVQPPGHRHRWPPAPEPPPAPGVAAGPAGAAGVPADPH